MPTAVYARQLSQEKLDNFIGQSKHIQPSHCCTHIYIHHRMQYASHTHATLMHTDCFNVHFPGEPGWTLCSPRFTWKVSYHSSMPTFLKQNRAFPLFAYFFCICQKVNNASKCTLPWLKSKWHINCYFFLEPSFKQVLSLSLDVPTAYMLRMIHIPLGQFSL